MPGLLLLLVMLFCTPAWSQAADQATTQTPPPGAPPGFPAPNQAPIPQLSPPTTSSSVQGPPPNVPPGRQPPAAGPSSAPGVSSVSTSATQPAPPTFEPPAEELGPNDVGLEHADSVSLDSDNNATIKGNVSLRYRTYTLFCDQAVINADTGIGVLSGHVRLRSDDGKVVVDSLAPDSRLTLNMRSGVYDVIGGSAVIAPSELPQITGLALPIRLYGGDIQEQPRFVDARDTSVTTCSFAEPHYFFKAKSTIIIPGKRLVARDVTFYRRHRKIITIPYLVFPLDNRYARQGLTPQVGYDEKEGYFAKFAVPYVLAAAAYGILRLDLMSAAGIGTGITQSFSTGGNQAVASPASTGAATVVGNPTLAGQIFSTGTSGLVSGNGGTVQLYHINGNSTGLDTTTGSLAANQTLFHNVRLSVDTQFENDSYQSSLSQSNSVSSLFSINRTVKGASTSVTANVQQSNYGSGTSSTITTSVDENNALSKITNLDLKLNLSQFSSPGVGTLPGSYQQTLATNLDLTSHPKGYQLEVLANTFSAASSSGSAIGGGVQRLPEINVQSVPSPNNHLLPHLLPALSKYILDLGYFQESVDNADDMRMQMGLDLGNNTHKHKAVTTNVAGSFLQAFYSDSTAEYVLQDQMGALYNFQKQSSFGVTYSYLRPYGYTPFLFDETGSYNNINSNFNYQPNKRLEVTLSSGFDIGADHEVDGLPGAPWLDVNGQVQYRIDNKLLNVFTSSYDPNDGMLFNVADTTRLTLPWGLAFNSALNYVPQSNRFANVNGDLDVPWITDKREQAGYTLRALAGYDGITDQVTYKGLELTRSWHDWELSAIYEQNAESLSPGSSFYLNFRLKAFPGYEPFGVGQFGQGLDTGIGQVY